MRKILDEINDVKSLQHGSGQKPLFHDDVVMPFEPGDVISGKYEVLRLIGAGAMGFVVVANHVELDQKVALKFLRPEALANTELVVRFAREARASARIKSEHIARVFDVGSLPDGAPFIVMEHLEGHDLGAVLRDRGPLPVRLAIDYALQACEALASAHASGIIHRDIKPENLFLAARNQGPELIKVLDFGISKVALTGSAFESKLPLVRTMTPMGSPVYMSPEQIRASADIDTRTDIWSLGCVLYELLTGNAPFDAPSLTQIAAMIIEQEPAPLERGCPDVPPELDEVVKRCLAKDPRARFQNVGELAVALYPYGPRRARLSAERCCMILRGEGDAQDDFELPSVFPAAHYARGESPRISVEVTAGTAVSVAPTHSEAPAERRTRRAWKASAVLGALGLVAIAAYWRSSGPVEIGAALVTTQTPATRVPSVGAPAPSPAVELAAPVAARDVALAPSPTPRLSASAPAPAAPLVAKRPVSAPALPKPHPPAPPRTAATVPEQDIGF